MKIYTRCNGIIGDIVTYDVIQICFFNMNFDINSLETSLENVCVFFFFLISSYSMTKIGKSSLCLESKYLIVSSSQGKWNYLGRTLLASKISVPFGIHSFMLNDARFLRLLSLFGINSWLPVLLQLNIYASIIHP